MIQWKAFRPQCHQQWIIESAITGVKKAKGTDFRGLPRLWSRSPLREKGPTLPLLSLSSSRSTAWSWLPHPGQGTWFR